MLEGLTPVVQPVDEVVNRIRAGVREVVITGAAGTGKTTLLREVIEKLGTQRRVVLTGPTGRCARRMREVTGRPATTVHSAIYFPPKEKGDQLIWQNRRTIGAEGNVVFVVDEASMIGFDLAEHIREAVVTTPDPRPNTILWVGDANQIPPVNEAPGVDLNGPEVVRLTKVWRSGDELVKFAHAILRCKTPRHLYVVLREFQSPCIHRVEPGGPTAAQWRAVTHKSGVDAMLITRRNEPRTLTNIAVRAHREHPHDMLVRDDVLLVRTNHAGMGVLNGEVYGVEHVQDPEEVSDLPTTMMRIRMVFGEDTRVCNVMPSAFGLDTRKFRDLIRDESRAWTRYYTRGRVFADDRWRQESAAYATGELDVRGCVLGPAQDVVHCDFGECITGHAAQGSEADYVGIVADEDMWWIAKNYPEAKAWWYTMATRARRDLLLWIG